MFELTEEQEDLVSKAVKSYTDSSEQVFQYTGSAGTGKSVVMNAIVEHLGLSYYDIAPMAYTGAAAMVMRRKGLLNARTIHSWLYEPKVILDYDNMDSGFNRPRKKLVFVPKDDLADKKLILIDEASFVPSKLRHDIERFGIKVIACGDLDQLPPVADHPAYLYNGTVHRLNQIMRQKEGNAIIWIAHRVLNNLPLEPGFYGNVMVITEDQLNNSMLSNADVVICGRNATREKFNKYIRREIVGFTGQLPVHGERMICRKNNWQIDADGINLANGLIGTVTSYPDVATFTGNTFQIDFTPDMFSGVFRNLVCDYKYFKADPKERNLIKNLPYSEEGEKFELAYAITTHISQGSQYDHGIYFQEYLHKDINRHLNYTGITRFSDWCIYVIPSRKYY